jgi:hypothetical protein
VPGTLVCHHFQSVASRPKTLPEAGVINVESYNVISWAAAVYVSRFAFLQSQTQLFLSRCLVMFV